MNWPIIALKRIATTVAGGTPEVSEPSFWADGNEGLPWVSIGDMSGRNVVDTTGRRVTESGIKAARLPVGNPGTLLFSMYASLGHTAFLKARASWNQAILGILPSVSCDARFLKYSLDSLRPQLSEFARSNTQANLNAEQVGNLRVSDLPLEQQRRIASFLDVETARIDNLIELQRKLIKKLDERETAELDIAIDNLVTRSGTVPLRRFIWAADQGVSPQCDGVPANESEWGVLKVSCLRPGIFVPEENKRLPEGTEPATNSEVREGDLLITRANTPQLVGSTAVVPRVRRKLLLSDKIFRVRLVDGVHPDFVATIARGSRVRALCAASSNGASQSMANIRFEEVKGWPIPVVGAEEQLHLVKKTSRRREQIHALRPAIDRQLNLLTERRQALITAAVTGQIDVSTASGRGIEE